MYASGHGRQDTLDSPGSRVLAHCKLLASAGPSPARQDNLSSVRFGCLSSILNFINVCPWDLFFFFSWVRELNVWMNVTSLDYWSAVLWGLCTGGWEVPIGCLSLLDSMYARNHTCTQQILNVTLEIMKTWYPFLKKSLQELSELNRLLKFSVRYVLIKFTMSFLKKS